LVKKLDFQLRGEFPLLSFSLFWVDTTKSFKFSLQLACVNKKVFVGVDGCRGGWFAVFLTAENDQHSEWETGLFPCFSSLINFLRMNYGQAELLILIGIPIGLKKGGYRERLSDIGARGILKARKSSIFPVPCREAVYAENYEKACEINKKLTEKAFPGRSGT
jgi:predicted RNase H-like nuclease